MTISLLSLFEAQEVAPPLAPDLVVPLAAELERLSGMEAYPRSITCSGHSLYFLGRRGTEKHLVVLRADPACPAGIAGTTLQVIADSIPLFVTECPTDASNASALRRVLPFLAPLPLGLRKSVGCGDRLGMATPGHVRAVRKSAMAPIFAQQSMRENARTGRSPQQVMDEALWGVFQEGWRDGFGADADHLKSASDVDVCAAAGYTFYTFDPGEHVDNSAGDASAAELERISDSLPWQWLETTAADLRRRLADKPIDLGDFSVTIGWEGLLRSAVKYGKAVAHTARLYRHLAGVMGERPFELEMSVDETETVTSIPEHIYIAHELKRLGVRWVSLAPRYLGTFEKGVDYIGDAAAFGESFARHLAVARTYGPYKLSLHSGSDKFSIYAVASHLAGGLVHLKTAGTSYLEALRAVAALNPGLFREIVAFCRERYPSDRASYHVSAEVGKMPALDTRRDEDLPALLHDFHAREILHVTFGSVLKEERLKQGLYATLRGDEETYYQMLEAHFDRHLLPFTR